MNTCADCGMTYDAEPLDCQWLCPICEQEENQAREELIWTDSQDGQS
jgi:predicted Zn-ribbon and HTH transcriptional regulator